MAITLRITKINKKAFTQENFNNNVYSSAKAALSNFSVVGLASTKVHLF